MSHLRDNLDDDDGQYFEKSSVGGLTNNQPGLRLMRAEYSSQISNQYEMQSNYHMDLLEEKREEI